MAKGKSSGRRSKSIKIQVASTTGSIAAVPGQKAQPRKGKYPSKSK